MLRPGALAAVVAMLALLVVGVLARATVGQIRTVGSGSMEPTLRPGERIAVATLGRDRWALDRGEIVLFDAADLWADPRDPAGTVFVKRIVGVGGDRIQCCDDRGRLLRDGVAVAESPSTRGPSDQVPFDVIVPDGHYWLLGDNRAASADSRAHLGDPGGGAVPASRMIGTVEAVVWPLGSIRRVEASDG